MVAREHPELDAALARAGDGVFAVAADGRIVLWNRAAERLLGFTAREVLGKPCCDVFSGHDDKGNRLCYQGCHVRTLVKLGESVQNFDMRTRTKGGRPVWLNFSIVAASTLHAPNAAATTMRTTNILKTNLPFMTPSCMVDG